MLAGIIYYGVGVVLNASMIWLLCCYFALGQDLWNLSLLMCLIMIYQDLIYSWVLFVLSIGLLVMLTDFMSGSSSQFYNVLTY